MNMQQMMIQAQKMQRELKKALDELNQTEFEISKGGAITIKMLGSLQVTSVEVDEDVLDKDNKEMIQDMIQLAINELIQQIEAKKSEINRRITGQSGGLPF